MRDTLESKINPNLKKKRKLPYLVLTPELAFSTILFSPQTYSYETTPQTYSYETTPQNEQSPLPNLPENQEFKDFTDVYESSKELTKNY